MLGTFINLIAAPKLAFAHLRSAPSIVSPLLLILIASAISTLVYFQLADPNLLVDDLLAQAGDDMSDAERADARASMESMPIATMQWGGAIAGSVSLLLMLLLQAGYLYLVSMFNGTKIGFKPWLSFVSWSSVPLVFAVIASLATIVFAPGHVSLSNLNPLTLTNLLNFESDNLGLVRWMDSVDLTRFWSVGLMVLGYRIWTDKSWLYSCVIVIAPVLVVYGAFLGFAL